MIELTIKEKELIRDIIWDFLNDKLKRENYKNRINELNDIMIKLTEIIHRTQLHWLTDEQIKDICNKQLTIDFDNKK